MLAQRWKKWVRPLVFTLAISLHVFAETAPPKHAGTPTNEKRTPDPLPNVEGFGCGALAEVIRINGGRTPRTKEEWESVLSKFGFQRTEFSFSNGLGRSGLGQPRYVYQINGTKDLEKKYPDLRDKLFVAVGTGLDGTPVVEFQSWNPLNRNGGFDFGSYEGMAVPHLDPIDKCIKCHMNYGPGMTVADWTSTRTFMPNFVAFVHWMHKQNPEKYQELYDEIERLRKAPDANQMVDISLGTLRSKFAINVENSPIVKKTLFENIPVLSPHSPFGAAGLQTTSEGVNRNLIFYQTFYGISDQDRRADFLEQTVEGRLKGALSFFFHPRADALTHFPPADVFSSPEPPDTSKPLSQLVALDKVPALNGALFHDRSHVTGQTKKDPTVFPQPGGPPSDEEITKILSYNEARMQAFDRGANPLAKEHSPANPSNRIKIEGDKLTVKAVQGFATLDVDIQQLERILRQATSESLKKAGKKIDPKSMSETALAAVDSALKSPPMQSLYKSPVVPTGLDLMNSFLDGLDFYFQKNHQVDYIRKQPRKFNPAISALDCYDREQRLAGHELNRCTRCHDEKSPLYKYVTDLPGWKRAMESTNPKISGPAIDWFTRSYGRVVDDKDMPPSYSREGKAFSNSDRAKELLRFFHDNQSFRPNDR
jgi:hypothetical protein